MKVLIVEDDFASRKVLQKLLAPYGDIDIAINGREALKEFSRACKEGASYDLICLDIMMPEMDGHETLKEIRRMEKEIGRTGLKGGNVIMTTALDDFENIMQSFKEECEGYIVKPIEREKLLDLLSKLGLM